MRSMKNPLDRKGGPGVLSDILWMSLLAGLSGVFVLIVIVGFFYVFDPVARIGIENWTRPLVWSAGAIFLAGFGISVWFAVGVQMRRRR